MGASLNCAQGRPKEGTFPVIFRWEMLFSGSEIAKCHGKTLENLEDFGDFWVLRVMFEKLCAAIGMFCLSWKTTWDTS